MKDFFLLYKNDMQLYFNAIDIVLGAGKKCSM